MLPRFMNAETVWTAIPCVRVGGTAGSTGAILEWGCRRGERVDLGVDQDGPLLLGITLGNGSRSKRGETGCIVSLVPTCNVFLGAMANQENFVSQSWSVDQKVDLTHPKVM